MFKLSIFVLQLNSGFSVNYYVFYQNVHFAYYDSVVYPAIVSKLIIDK